jgi:hypothetical protein
MTKKHFKENGVKLTVNLKGISKDNLYVDDANNVKKLDTDFILKTTWDLKAAKKKKYTITLSPITKKALNTAIRRDNKWLARQAGEKKHCGVSTMLSNKGF